jgi:microcystin-dependent protein
MSEPFVGEIRMFAGNFAPRSWAFCDGQLLAVSQNDALFSLFGTIYGGDGRTTFGLPDLRGRVPIHHGQGPGLSNRRLGTKSGNEKETLIANEVAPHTHTLTAGTTAASDTNPAGNITGTSTGTSLYGPDGTAPAEGMNSQAVKDTGGNRSHSNIMPFLCIHFIVALLGVYPSRT